MTVLEEWMGLEDLVVDLPLDIFLEELHGWIDQKYQVYMEGEAEEGKLIVEHDPGIATMDQLIEAFKMLPSFYEGFFIPTVITA